MTRTSVFLVSTVSLAFISITALSQQESDAPMTFFVTSQVNGGDLGGLAGADAICQKLATAAGAGDHTWRAYLSTHGTPRQPAVNARDRIGDGPWHNAKGVMIAASLADLHGDIQRDSNLIYRETALTEKGDIVNGRVRPEGANNEHDMLTGSDSHGRAFPPGLASAGDDRTCQNWTYAGADGSAMIGHHDRLSSWNTSWNSSHSTRGCSLENFTETGGAGRFYCFAAD
ncbi:MAG: lectin [Gammaproteobacteria bacterium]|nr:lectin [Gammaproteobacteria bacterium]